MRPRSALVLLALAIIAWQAPHAGIESPAKPGPAVPALPAGEPREAPEDTLPGAIPMPGLTIRAKRLGRAIAAGEVRLGEQAVEVIDGRTIVDLAPLLPSTKAGINSRGEALFMVRGASERHTPVFLEGIPLTVPWDERADLSMIPTDAIAEVSAQRGVHSALDGANALAGSVQLVPLEQMADGQTARLTAEVGEGNHFETHLTNTRKRGEWNALAALAHRQWSAWLVPDDVNAPRHQPARRSRTNSDLAQTAFTFRVGRDWRSGSHVSLVLLAADGTKGVPPETHLSADEARFWRYPQHRRLVLGVTGGAFLDAGQRWNLQASASADFFRQEIQPFDDAAYNSPSLTPGIGYEMDRDRTGTIKMQLSHRVGPATRVTGKGTARYANHRESLLYRGEELGYAQWILSTVAEVAHQFHSSCLATAGAGFESAVTPETGDKPRRGPTSAPVLVLRVEKRWSQILETYATASRRSRFPSLRELYSGALGKFIPNPNLDPEDQELYEVGALADWAGGEIGVSAFAGYLHDGIEKVSRGGGKSQRVNVHEVRTLGLETICSWRPLAYVCVQASHTILHSRRRDERGYVDPAEDRPDYESACSAGWEPPSGFGMRLEAMTLGPRHSLDTTDPVDGLRRLPAQGTWSLRLCWRWPKPAGWTRNAELFLRVNNLADQTVESQTGLPEPGRMLLAGVKLDLGE
jgi:iron complex outermembrane receptor protein